MKKAKKGVPANCPNVHTGDFSEDWLDVWINPEENEIVLRVENTTDSMAVAVSELGFFPSKNLARKNGWGGQIPFGYQEWQIGKKFFVSFRPVFLRNSDELTIDFIENADEENTKFLPYDLEWYVKEFPYGV